MKLRCNQVLIYITIKIIGKFYLYSILIKLLRQKTYVTIQLEKSRFLTFGVPKAQYHQRVLRTSRNPQKSDSHHLSGISSTSDLTF